MRTNGIQIAVSVVLFGLVPYPGSATADVITVDDDDPAADFATIQEAVDAAADGDLIEVGPGYYFNDVDGSSVPVVKVEGKSIQIVAVNIDPDLTIIAGQGFRRCVEWRDSAGDCKLIGFTLDSGRSATRGGGLFIDSTALEISDCVFGTCSAGSDGGAIASTSETVIPPAARGCRFVQNFAGGDGGAIAAIGGFDLFDCRFQSNTTGNAGGGAFFDGNPAGKTNFNIINNCDFVNCAGVKGGGVFGIDATLNVNGSNFDGCNAGDPFSNIGFGGGLGIAFGSLVMDGGRFSGCEGGESSGGLDVDRSDAVVSNVDFLDNVGWVFGGGVHLFDAGSSLSLQNCSFARNVAVEGVGAGVSCDQQALALILDQCTFEDHVGFLEGVCISAPNIVTATDCEFGAQDVGQFAVPAQHVALNGVGTGSRFERCRFTDATSVDLASSVRATNIGGLEFIDCDFLRNETEQAGLGDDAEGAVYIHANAKDDSPIVFDGCRFESNRICCWLEQNNGGSGGALRVRGRRGSLTNCIFANNRAALGGSVYGAFDIANCLLEGGASVGSGGAAYLFDSSTLTESRISGSADCNYPAFRSAGPIAVEGCTVTGSFGLPFVCLEEPVDLAVCSVAAGSTFQDTRFCDYSEAAIDGAWTDLGGNSFQPAECDAADLNGDGEVNGADLALILAGWGQSCLGCAIDINQDGEVNGADLALVLAGWGP